MKMFMKSYFENEAREVKPPLEYEYICLACAGKLGGKLAAGFNTHWKMTSCDMCGKKTESTDPHDFIWR
jgi:hypothetical protein